MNPIRLILVVALIWLAFYVVKRLRARIDRAPQAKAVTTRMVRCARCGLHVPEAEAVRDGDRAYCSIEHREQGG